jgi:hypothetical protein
MPAAGDKATQKSKYHEVDQLDFGATEPRGESFSGYVHRVLAARAAIPPNRN